MASRRDSVSLSQIKKTEESQTLNNNRLMGGSDLVQEGTKNDLGKGESEPQNVPSGMDSDSGSEECLSPVSNVQIGSGGGDVEDDEVGRTGWITASLLIVNAALGAGLLNFPSAFNQAGGVAVGISVQLVNLITNSIPNSKFLHS